MPSRSRSPGSGADRGAQPQAARPSVAWYRKTRVQAALVAGILGLAGTVLAIMFRHGATDEAKPVERAPATVAFAPPSSAPQSAPAHEADTSEALRTLHGVRPLAVAESDLSISDLPRGTYGFASGYRLDLPDFRVSRKQYLGSFEVHKLATGNVLVLGFVGPETARELARDTPKHGLKLALYSSKWQEAPRVVALDLSAVKSQTSRDLELDDGDRIEVLDIEVR